MVTQTQTFIERHVANLSVTVVFLGGVVAIAVPYIMPHTDYFGLTPNEIGDAFGGLANPVIGFMGVCLTFLAFYIQYKSNERQNYELEVQKKENAYRFIRESIRDLKDDIKALRYTKERVVYHYSEAIWNVMLDNMLVDEEKDSNKKIVLNPLFFQISYILTLFEPIISDIDNADLEKKEKYQLLINIMGLFEASFEFVLKVQQQMTQEGKEKSIREFVRHNIIIPSKKIKNEMQEALDRYKESEKELFAKAITKIKGAAYVKNYRCTSGKATVLFFADYDEYRKQHPHTTLTEETYEEYFSKDDNISKILLNESVRLLVKLEFLERITFQLPFDKQTYSMTLGRKTAEEYFDLDLVELKIDKNLWRDEFVGKYVYSQKERTRFMKTFVKITPN
jgi:hypothetical protein